MFYIGTKLGYDENYKYNSLYFPDVLIVIEMLKLISIYLTCIHFIKKNISLAQLSHVLN